MNKLIALIFLLSLFSCSNDDTIAREKPLDRARDNDETFEVLIPPSMDKPLVNCYEYKPACSGGYKVKIKRLEVIALQYDNAQDALKSAKRIQGYWLKNWAFDDVAGEPVLERFFETHMKAVKASEVKK